jgi:succinate dehydrogenase / fumarate reductase cytochrome b subunit
MQKQRPMFLNLLQIRFPIMAIVSILHRISGVLLFLLIPVLLYYLQLSLRSPYNYQLLATSLNTIPAKVGLFIAFSLFIYHVIAGIRHLIMDMGFAESLRGGRIGAWLILLLSIALIISTGFYLWP